MQDFLEDDAKLAESYSGTLRLVHTDLGAEHILIDPHILRNHRYYRLDLFFLTLGFRFNIFDLLILVSHASAAVNPLFKEEN